jgi:hypothetical protein
LAGFPGDKQSPNPGADPTPEPGNAGDGANDAGAESDGEASHGSPGAGSAGNPGMAEKAPDRLDPFEAENEAEVGPQSATHPTDPRVSTPARHLVLDISSCVVLRFSRTNARLPSPLWLDRCGFLFLTLV